MKKSLVVFFIALVSSITAFGQKIEFKVQFSETLAVFEFMQNLSSGNPKNDFVEVFEQSTYNNEHYQSLIKEFGAINYFYWYEYPQYPYGSKIQGGAYFILGRNLIQSENFSEFKTKSFGIIPNADLEKLVDILIEFQPIYKEIVFIPTEEKFNQQLKSVSKLIESVDINLFFNQAKAFHNSSWNNSIPFVLNLHPIPDSRKKGFTASAYYNYAVSGIPNGLTDYEQLLSVMFHEAFHILYDEQGLAVKNTISNWFEDNPSPTAVYANLLFNEAITTSLANGYLYRELTGNLPTGQWYNNQYIGSMAKEMFPLVEEYLNEGKQIDQDFINDYISLFENSFPDWFTEVNQVMMQRYIISENPKGYSAIRRKFRYSNITEYSDKFDVLTFEEMKSHPVTKVIVVTDEHDKKVKFIKENFGELKNWNPETSKDFTHTQLLEDRTYLVIINAVNKPVEELLESLTIN